MSGRGPGLMLVLLGVGLVVAGLLVWSGALSWFGRLPGDLRWDTGRSRVHLPITSMLLVSVLLSVVLSVLSWIFQRLR